MGLKLNLSFRPIVILRPVSSVAIVIRDPAGAQRGENVRVLQGLLKMDGALLSDEFRSFIVGKLLKEKKFQAMIEERVVQKLWTELNSQEREEKDKKSFKQRYEEGKRAELIKDISEAVDSLEVGLRVLNSSFALPLTIGPEYSKARKILDSRTFFDVKLMMARMEVDFKLNVQAIKTEDRADPKTLSALAKCASTTRAVTRLAKLLASRLENADLLTVTNLSTAATDYAMLLKKLACCLVIIPEMDALQMVAGTSQFVQNIAVPLSKVARDWKETEARALKDLENAVAESSPVAKRRERKVEYVRSPFRPTGYLLPSPLREKRRALAGINRPTTKSAPIRRPCRNAEDPKVNMNFKHAAVQIGKKCSAAPIQAAAEVCDQISFPPVPKETVRSRGVQIGTQEAGIQVHSPDSRREHEGSRERPVLPPISRTMLDRLISAQVAGACMELDEACDAIVDKLLTEEFNLKL